MDFILNFFNKNDKKTKKHKPMPVKIKVITLMIIFTIGFIIFITSNLWLVTKNDFNSNQIYDTLTVSDDISLKLRRWSYNPNTKQTEIEIGKNFSSVKNDLQFSLNVLGNGTTFIKANIDYDSPTLWVISLENLPFNTKYIRLEFTVKIDDKIYGSSFTMDLKSDEIEIDTNLKLHKTEQEYLTKSLSYEQEQLKQTLSENQEIIKSSTDDISSYTNELNSLQNNDMTNATKEELDILNKKINNLNEEIKKLNDLIQNKTEENKSLENDIQILESKLNEKEQ